MLIALFVALGDEAIAGNVHIDTVGDFKIPKDAIRGKHVKNDGLTGKDISEKTVNSDQVNAGILDGSTPRRSFSTPTRPAAISPFGP